MRLGIPRRDHMRYTRFERVRRQKLLPWFLDQEGADLGGSASALTVVPTAHAAAIAATGTLTLTQNPANTETVTISGKVYTFQTVLTNVDGHVLIGATASDSLDNLIAAINLGAGSAVKYAAATTKLPNITAAAGAGDTMTLTADVAGTAGNAFATIEGLTNGSFGAATLTGGAAEVHASLAAAAHGLQTGAGPFFVASSGTLPAGLSTTRLYWAIRVDANTLALARSPELADAGTREEFTTAGSGTRTLTRGTTRRSLFEVIRGGKKPVQVARATDIDTL